MDLNEVIFTDGKIISFTEGPDRLRALFVDYDGDTITLEFTGHVTFSQNDPIGFDIADWTLTHEDKQSKLVCVDDEGSEMFSVVFDRGFYSKQD